MMNDIEKPKKKEFSDIIDGIEVDKFSLLPQIPKCLRIRSVIKDAATFNDAEKVEGYRKGAHVMIWAPWPGENLWGKYRAAVMMHVRFDGTFGFPGGLVDEGEDVIEGLTRELEEEIGWASFCPPLTWNDYYSSYVLNPKKLVLHFFIKEISLPQFIQLEKCCLTAPEYGKEVFGSVRIPLYTREDMYGGLPAFINHKFAGNAKQQLLLALVRTQIFNELEIEEVMLKSQNLKLAPSRM